MAKATSFHLADGASGRPRPPANISVAEALPLVRQERARIVRALEAARAEEHEAEVDGDAAVSIADAASEAYEVEVAMSVRAALEVELAELEAADRRLTLGTYGYCERCHSALDRERLRAEPATRWCRDHAAETIG